MFTDVPVSVSGLSECLSTVWAGVRSLPGVDPHVDVQFVFADEAFTAAGAHVWLVSGMVALVHLQLRHAAVGPAALGTFVAGRSLHVLPAVQAQPAVGPEALGALGTLEGLLSGVNVDVQLEAGSGWEAVAADGAEVRPFAGVDSQVLLELVLVEERPAADGARHWLLPLV